MCYVRGMLEPPPDPRYGHGLSQVQDEAGVDLLLLKRQLELSVEERLLRLEQQIEFARELQGAPRE